MGSEGWAVHNLDAPPLSSRAIPRWVGYRGRMSTTVSKEWKDQQQACVGSNERRPRKDKLRIEKDAVDNCDGVVAEAASSFSPPPCRVTVAWEPVAHNTHHTHFILHYADTSLYPLRYDNMPLQKAILSECSKQNLA